MNDQFKPILDALIKEGFHQLPDKNPTGGRPFDFKITPYSLNTKLSFKFDSLDHFIAFLKWSEPDLPIDKVKVLNATFMELGLNPKEFFYVNFYEKGKDLEM
jgi:hypothetical protein